MVTISNTIKISVHVDDSLECAMIYPFDSPNVYQFFKKNDTIK